MFFVAYYPDFDRAGQVEVTGGTRTLFNGGEVNTDGVDASVTLGRGPIVSI